MNRRSFLLAAGSLAAAPGWMKAKGHEAILNRVVEGNAEATPGKWTLWYDAPAHRWLDAMPLGNGNIGAMVFGGVDREQIALNEVTMWSGEEWNGRTDNGGKEVLTAIQQAFIQDDYKKAVTLMGQFSQTSEAHERIGTRLPVGDLFIQFRPVSNGLSNYCRQLDMERSLVSVDFQADSVHHHREMFVSNPDKVMVIRLAASQKGALSFSVSVNKWQPKEFVRVPVIVAQRDELVLSGQALEGKHTAGFYGVHFEVRIRILTEAGIVHSAEQSLVVEGANAATLLVSITTDFRGMDYQGAGKQRIRDAAAKSYDQLRKAHFSDFQSRFNRVDLTLGSGEDPAASQGTDKRITAFHHGANDWGLVAQFFQFSRYLTLAGSREDSRLPMPLQGLWADGIAASMGWSDDYHLDINTQQNYWIAEVGNLGECTAPLMDFIGQLRLVGRQSAQSTYGARGWCAHVTANAWAAAPWNHRGAPTCGAWQASHLWEHYAFGGDKTFLRDFAYPILKESAEFFLDVMVKDPRTGWLVTCPAFSPENRYSDPVTGEMRSWSLGNTGDTEIVYELFRECIAASLILDVDAELRAQLELAQRQLPPLEKLIHKDGRLMEWLNPAYNGEYARNNRHTTHLLGVFPFDQITPDKMPSVAAAARATLADKLSRSGWEDTEWTRGNFINFYARLRDGDAALSQIRALFENWIPGSSLLTVSQGSATVRDIFCLDGNTAGASGVAEMLVQSHSGQVELLPALPKEWPDGHISGLRARGGFEVEMEWKDSRLRRAEIISLLGNPLRIRLGARALDFHLRRGQKLQLDGELRSIGG